MAMNFLEFEQPIAELEAKIDELSTLSETSGRGGFDAEIAALRARLEEQRAWHRTTAQNSVPAEQETACETAQLALAC